MDMEASVAAGLRAAGEKARMDASCKRLLSEKRILAWIMKSCLEEYRDCTPQEIAEQYIEGTPQVGEEPVYPDEAPRIHGMSNEDSSMHEGTVVYDVRFTALAPSTGESIRLIINLEAQNNYYPGYPIVTRALYYCCRLISSQYGREFMHGQYDKIKKVYSIWICSEVPENRKNSIFRYRISEDVFAGKTREREQKQHYDMMTALILCLGKPQDKKENMALDLLSSLLSEELSAEEKLKILNEEFQIPITQQLDEEVSLMCNLSQGIENRGIQKGMEKGIEKGKIQGAIDMCRDLNLPEEEILQRIMQKFNLSEDTAREYLQKEE